jgi:hypothetical protein
MTEKTFNNRAKAAGLRKNSIAHKELFALLSGEKAESRPDISDGRNVRVYTDDMLFYAQKMNIGLNRGNNAPRGGIAGNFCYLNAKGKRQMF